MREELLKKMEEVQTYTRACQLDQSRESRVCCKEVTGVKFAAARLYDEVRAASTTEEFKAAEKHLETLCNLLDLLDSIELN